MTTKTHHFLPAQFFPKENRYTVLVVDDLPVNRVLLSKVLNLAGYAVIEADSAEAAVELIATGEIVPDVIITDVEMPGMSGLAMTDEIRGLAGPLSRIPVIMASGNPDERMELAAYEVGANAFLSKPFDLKELREEVSAAIKGIPRSTRQVKDRVRRNSEPNELRTRR